MGLDEDDINFLREEGLLSDHLSNSQNNDNDVNINHGCWVPRRVDSMAIIVVDALRFDFARDHLPLSIGSRLLPTNNNNRTQIGASKLYQFVADPPTVTMQRLKGLTTGGLPTFADISGSFGGATIEEDSWVEQLVTVPWSRRSHSMGEKEISSSNKPNIAFVGDDTWVDLFPTQFDDCHPYPSFNTRDLDTVDNGCLEHLPRLLDGLVGPKNDANSTSFELIVAHFLGVDHVGHTYGPNNPHMERKLHQMDVMLSNALNIIDNAPRQSCIAAMVLGDHGMTEDGNHGGGTSDEVNAGLFVHFSPGCQNIDSEDAITKDEVPGSARAFDSIHQIDLVPTISLLMGLPIPYANIGGLVPDLLPPVVPPRSDCDNQQSSSPSTPHIATALALNAAQVWQYLHTYSKISRDLPMDRLKELKELLDGASSVFRDAISLSRKHSKEKKKHTDQDESEEEEKLFDSTSYRQACALFKLFLAESTDLGKQVWTQFNERGMMIGIGILFLAWITAIPLWKRSVRDEIFGAIFFWNRRVEIDGKKRDQSIKENVKGIQSFFGLEILIALTFMIFQCGVLTFGNSYIENEREIVTFFLTILCLLVFRRWYFLPTAVGNVSAYLPLVVALCSRLNDVFITGHGLDPSIRLHPAHHSVVFLSSLCVLVILRLLWLHPVTKIGNSGPLFAAIDILAIIFLAGSWWEKRSLDHSRNGFIMARFGMVAVFLGLAHFSILVMRQWKMNASGRHLGDMVDHSLFRVLIFLMSVTGPSAASTAVLIVIQCAALRQMMESVGTRSVPSPVMAAIWRLVIRHVFFATNHHCSFNRLQYSAAFVATNTFQFYIAGFSLFMNTFGWEILGSTLVLVYSRRAGQSSSKSSISGSNVWDWYRYFQCTEMLASCMSVSVMKRHLMVWAVFAPRFMFSAVFTVVGLSLWFLDAILATTHRKEQNLS